MSRGLRAGAAFGLLLLAAGTLLGTLRVLLVAPRVGAGWALVIELPLMLAFAWVAAGRLCRRFAVADAPAGLAMAAAALAVLLAGEAALAALLSGVRPAEWLSGFARPAAWPGLAAQVAACLMPLVRHLRH